MQSGREIIYGGAVGWEQDRFSSRVEVSSSDADLATDTPEDFFTRFELDTSIREVDWQNDVVLPGDQRLVAGLEYRREQADSVSVSGFGSGGFEEKVEVVGVYVQDRVGIGERAGVTGAVRYEDHSSFGGKWTGRATATVDASDLMRVHGSVGTGFKAPTLNDLYFPGFSNPDLMPEESLGVDAGVELFVAAVRAHIGATFFYNDIRDLIEFDFVSSRPENLGDVTTAGAELNGEYVAGCSRSPATTRTPTRSLKGRANSSFDDPFTRAACDSRCARRSRCGCGARFGSRERVSTTAPADVRGSTASASSTWRSTIASSTRSCCARVSTICSTQSTKRSWGSARRG